MNNKDINLMLPELPERRYERDYFEKDSLDSIKNSGALDMLINFMDNEDASAPAIDLLKSVNYKMMTRTCRFLHIYWKITDEEQNSYMRTPNKEDFQHMLCQGMIEIWKVYQSKKTSPEYDVNAINTYNASLNNIDVQLVINEPTCYYQWNVKFNIEDITRFHSVIQASPTTS